MIEMIETIEMMSWSCIQEHREEDDEQDDEENDEQEEYEQESKGDIDWRDKNIKISCQWKYQENKRVKKVNHMWCERERKENSMKVVKVKRKTIDIQKEKLILSQKKACFSASSGFMTTSFDVSKTSLSSYTKKT